MRKIFFAILSFCALTMNAQNPYLPLWEHLPDGEPRVFEDPDNPGKYRAYMPQWKTSVSGVMKALSSLTMWMADGTPCMLQTSWR